MIGPILRRAEAGRQPSHREVALLLQAKGSDGQALLHTARRVVSQHKGEAVCFWGLLTVTPRENPSGLTQAADAAWRMGCSTVCLHAVEQVDPEVIANVIARIKRSLPVHVALELGEHGYDEYLLWRQAGADRYILPHETSHPAQYAQLHPGRSPSDRIMRYLWLRGLGYQVGGGIISPSVDEHSATLVDDIEVLMNMGSEAVVLQPFTNPADVYKLLAVVRLCLPRADIWVKPNHPELQSQSLMCGANVVLTAVPQRYLQPAPSRSAVPAGGSVGSEV